MVEMAFQVSLVPQVLKAFGVDQVTTVPPAQLVQTVNQVNKVLQVLMVLQVSQVLQATLQTENLS